MMPHSPPAKAGAPEQIALSCGVVFSGKSERWSAFANATAGALGLNLWVSLLLLPAVLLGTLEGPAILLIAVVPPVLLGIGLWRHHDVTLLFLFPVSLLLPLGVWPSLASTQVYGIVRIHIVNETFGNGF